MEKVTKKVILDLGCGGNKYEGSIGIDVVGPPATAADIVCHLGFEEIPMDDNSVDLVIARQFLEHVPHCVWSPGVIGHADGQEITWRRFQPSVFLFNEIYRVLKGRGVLHAELPTTINPLGQATQPAFQDPTHCSYWVPETLNYFAGDYYGFHEVYGHTSRFQRKSLNFREYNGWLMEFELEAVKDIPDDYPYLLNYDSEEDEGHAK